MMPGEAQQLAEELGCLVTEAAAVLEAEPRYVHARIAMLAVMQARRQLYYRGLLATWQQFAQPGSLTLDVYETIEFYKTLGVPMEDPLLLAVAYELQAREVGRLDFGRFVDGWARLEVSSLEQMQQYALPMLSNRLQTNFAYFREVYRYTFRLNLTPGMRLLDHATALSYWNLLLGPKYPLVIPKWLEFYGEKEKHNVSSDTWNMLLEFCVYVEEKDPDLTNYDETSAWPAAIDDFVEFQKTT